MLSNDYDYDKAHAHVLLKLASFLQEACVCWGGGGRKGSGGEFAINMRGVRLQSSTC